MTTQWIKVTDSLPDNGRSVLFIDIYAPIKSIRVGYYEKDDGWQTEHDQPQLPTHWMELPPLPTTRTPKNRITGINK